jgi:hypothetical protein
MRWLLRVLRLNRFLPVLGLDEKKPPPPPNDTLSDDNT